MSRAVRVVCFKGFPEPMAQRCQPHQSVPAGASLISPFQSRVPVVRVLAAPDPGSAESVRHPARRGVYEGLRAARR